MKRSLTLAAAIAFLMAPAAAQTPQMPGNIPPGLVAPLAPENIPPGTYEVLTKETLVRYTVNHEGFSEFWGTFPGATGTLTIDPKAIGATKLDVKIPIWMVETTNRELNGELFSDEFFDAENYPWMHFVSTDVTQTGPRTAKVTGNLTMHNVTRPVVLKVVFNGAGINPLVPEKELLTLGFNAVGEVKRSDFGLGKYVPIVGDETTITISAEFSKK